MPDAAPEAYPFALTLLARRELSTAQLRERLAARGVPPDETDAAIARLTRDGSLDDRRVAVAYARTAGTVKGRGRLRILRELAGLGIADDLARAAVEEALDPADAARALERAVARLPKGPLRDGQDYRRACARLLRLGFSAPEIRRALAPRRAGGDAGDRPDDDAPQE